LEETFATHGLPPLGKQNGSSSHASKNDGHKKAILYERTFNILKNLTLHGGEVIWTKFRQNCLSSWSSEADIQSFVQDVISDALTSIGLEKKLICQKEMSVFKVRPDIWVVTIGKGIPVGVIEVKKPDEKIMSSELVHGQIYDYMIRLQSFHGLKNVFGIVTTYTAWRVYWLPNTDPVAAADVIDEGVSVTDAKQTEEETEGSGSIESSEEIATTRLLYGSPVYSWDNKGLPLVLGSVLKKMYHSDTETVKRIDPNRPYITMTKDAWLWEKVKWGRNFTLDYKTMPSGQPKKLFMLEDFRGGVDGRVWLACTGLGEMCAIKFDHDNNKEALELEAKNWQEIWGMKSTQVIELGGKYALMMPYVKPIENWEDPQVRKAVIKATRKMAKLGRIHRDLDPRHVGMITPMKKGDPITVVFFDLRQIEREDNESVAMEEMFKRLNIDASVAKKLTYEEE
jgi:hypothetical protein